MAFSKRFRREAKAGRGLSDENGSRRRPVPQGSLLTSGPETPHECMAKRCRIKKSHPGGWRFFRNHLLPGEQMIATSKLLGSSRRGRSRGGGSSSRSRGGSSRGSVDRSSSRSGCSSSRLSSGGGRSSRGGCRAVVGLVAAGQGSSGDESQGGDRKNLHGELLILLCMEQKRRMGTRQEDGHSTAVAAFADLKTHIPNMSIRR